MRLARYLSCVLWRGHQWQWWINLYGDAINTFSTSRRVYRSLWTCRYCGAHQRRAELHRG